MTDDSPFTQLVKGALEAMHDTYTDSNNEIARLWTELLATPIRGALQQNRRPCTNFYDAGPLHLDDEGRLAVDVIILAEQNLRDVDGVVLDINGRLDFQPPFHTKLGLPRGDTYRWEMVIGQPVTAALPWFTP